MVDMEPPKSVDATLFGSSEALIHRSGSGISVLLGVSDGYLRTHPGKPFSSANFQGVVAEL
jgi:hypothetical protein